MSHGKTADAMKMWTRDIERAIRAHSDHINSASNQDADEWLHCDAPLPPASPWNEADARCARCSDGENIGELVAEMDQALIAYANRELSSDPVWQQLYAVRQAMVATL